MCLQTLNFLYLIPYFTQAASLQVQCSFHFTREETEEQRVYPAYTK